MIACSCGVVSVKALTEAAQSGMTWQEARVALNVANTCGRCSPLAKRIFYEAREKAGYHDHKRKARQPRPNEPPQGTTGDAGRAQ